MMTYRSNIEELVAKYGKVQRYFSDGSASGNINGYGVYIQKIDDYYILQHQTMNWEQKIFPSLEALEEYVGAIR